ncbi:ATPase [Colletotrichum orchidophilum]|uniref:ATPase n=1 Tax=Colletotrichum orchidophilum TaxID=1209926 RepID=A0A1G4BNA9_9PEZI|nr:ATPase [Colletotrichum orchidophilum]OHF02950.1 ATPase [Colletotrichum orchidophilum]
MASPDQGIADRQSESTLADPATANMDSRKDSATIVVAPASAPQAKASKSTKVAKKDKKKAKKSKSKKQFRKAKKHKKATTQDTDDLFEDTTDDSDSETDETSSESKSSSSESSDDEQEKIKSKKKSRITKGKNSRSTKKHKSLRKRTPSSSSSSSDTDSSEDSDDTAGGKGTGMTRVSMTPHQLALFRQMQRGPPTYPKSGGLDGAGLGYGSLHGNKAPTRGKSHPPLPKGRPSPKLDFKRVNQVWDNTIHNYRLQETTATTSDSQYDGYVLQVRRTFDWEGKYLSTYLDIKSKILRECLQEVIGNIKGISLVDETPKLNPNMVFLYLEDLRKYRKALSKISTSDIEKKRRKTFKKDIENKRQHLKVLLKYLDKDYAQVKKSLYPMLENGLITFDLLWALFKPNTLIYTTTYGSPDEPRVFKVEQAEKMNSITKGDFYLLDGKYLEYDGKQFGYGTLCEEIPEFRGARKISSLNTFPLDFHKDKEAIRTTLIERGKKFVKLGGVNYRSHQGLAYYKKKKSIIKVNINGRIMVDPSVHRRINPNYQVSVVRPKDHDILSDSEDSDSEESCGQGDSDSENACDSDDDAGCETMVTKVGRDGKGKVLMFQIPKDMVEEAASLDQQLERIDKGVAKAVAKEASNDSLGSNKAKGAPELSDEDYLIASSVVLGFSFSEKLWLEFTVSGVGDIQWNDGAYESLVLEPKQKDIVKALVESHKYHATESIDDVIQGKGKGLVAVLHGPPGTGKTLTAEGISELLKCPLYMVSAGELGTDSRYLETELQKILDICHAWGAILLLDEADVFLEKRNLHEISRNALTFDDAFQSRIHIALRYDSLAQKAKESIFKIFVERVRVLEKVDLKPFTKDDYKSLAKHDLNGRQIKNTVRTAQALAVNKGESLGMEHILQVLDVQNSFDLHLKGGESYKDAMRSYY